MSVDSATWHDEGTVKYTALLWCCGCFTFKMMAYTATRGATLVVDFGCGQLALLELRNRSVKLCLICVGGDVA